VATFLTSLLYVLSVVTSLFLIFLVLIQRGKGGGLAGAFGGVGGSSAFGTKAGDVFTRVTIYTALAWFLINMFLVYRMNQGRSSVFGGAESRTKSTAPKDAGKGGKGDAAGTKAGDEPAKDIPASPASDGLPPALQDMDKEPAPPAPLAVPEKPSAAVKSTTTGPARPPTPAAAQDELPDPFGPAVPGATPTPAPKAP